MADLEVPRDIPAGKENERNSVLSTAGRKFGQLMEGVRETVAGAGEILADTLIRTPEDLGRILQTTPREGMSSLAPAVEASLTKNPALAGAAWKFLSEASNADPTLRKKLGRAVLAERALAGDERAMQAFVEEFATSSSATAWQKLQLWVGGKVAPGITKDIVLQKIEQEYVAALNSVSQAYPIFSVAALRAVMKAGIPQNAV